MSTSGTRWGTIGGEPLRFLVAFRRRKLLLWFLVPGCLAAAAVNEAVRWAAVGINRWRGLDLPVLDVGPPFLLVALIVAFRHWRPGPTAALADRTLNFEDRLTSLVDFADRGDIPPPVLAAQREEVSHALGERSAATVLPLRPALFAGPLLLLASLAYPLLLPTSEVGLVQLVRRIAPPPGGRGTRSNGTLDAPGNAPKPAQSPQGPRTPAGDAEKAAPPTQSPATGEPRAEPDAERVPQSRDANRRLVRSPNGPLVSNQVGSDLTKVVNPLFQESRPRPAPPEEQARGTIAFRLLPKSGKTGAGEGSGSGENPEAATLDLDAVPETYRQLVKTYFTLLGGGAGVNRPDDGGTPPQPTRKD